MPVTEYTMPSFTAAALTAVNFGLAFLILPEPRQHATSVATTGESRIQRLYDVLRSPDIGPLVLAFFLVSFAFAAFESQFIFRTSDRLGYGTAENAISLTYIGVVVALVQGGLIGPLTDRFGEYRLALTGAAIQFVALALVPFSLSWSLVPSVGPVTSGAVALALVSTPLAFGNALTIVSLNALVSLNATADAQGGAFGLTQSASSLARTFGPAVAGLLYVAVAYWSPFLVAALLFVPIRVVLRLIAPDQARMT